MLPVISMPPSPKDIQDWKQIEDNYRELIIAGIDPVTAIWASLYTYNSLKRGTEDVRPNVKTTK